MRHPNNSTPIGGDHRFRIIGGEWRGRRLTIPAATAVRPTPDRVRETLFNWLQGWVSGARCLDLFSGSGALGIEALSRGAAAVTFVELDQSAFRTIQQHIKLLDAQGAELFNQPAAQFLAHHPVGSGYDLVFLDPPFHQGMIPSLCQQLVAHGWLRQRAHIYLESESPIDPQQLPEGMTLDRCRKAGQVWHALACYHRPTPL